MQEDARVSRQRPNVEGDRHGILGLLQAHIRHLRPPAPGLDSEIGPLGFPFSRAGESSLQCEGKHPRSLSASALGAPVAGGDACLTRRCVPVWLVAPYWPGPDTVKFSELDSFLPSPVQIAPSAAQSVVAGSSMVTSPVPCGFTVMSQGMLLGLSVL